MPCLYVIHIAEDDELAVARVGGVGGDHHHPWQQPLHVGCHSLPEAQGWQHTRRMALPQQPIDALEKMSHRNQTGMHPRYACPNWSTS